MDPFTLQRSLAKQLLKSKPTFTTGMRLVQTTLERKCPKVNVKACRDIPWDKALTRWVAWMENLTRHHAPPPLALLWFETPSELNPAMTSVSGWTTLAPASESFGADEARAWPVNQKGYTLPKGLHAIPELEQAWQRLGWRDDNAGNAPEDQLLAAVYALAYATTLLLTINGLPKTRFAASLRANTALGVTTGWAEGDIEAVGGFNKGNWVAIPKGQKAAVMKHSNPPDDLEFYEPRKYLARGGDAKWRDPKTGETMLHNLCYTASVRDARALIDAGADVAAVTKLGESVLHSIGAAEIPLFRFLLTAGADPNAATRNGASVWDRLLKDGRTTTKHLQCMFGVGAIEPHESPLLRIAETGFWKEDSTASERAQLVFWLNRGWKVDQLGSEGLSPLWIALRLHARNVAWMLRKQRAFGDPYCTDEYKHDTTAIMLLQLGANPNQRLKKSPHRLIPHNATPLMVRRYDDDRLVRALLKHGADPHARSAEGKTALDYARLAARTPAKPGCTAAAKVAAILEKAMQDRTTTTRKQARKRGRFDQ